MSLYTFITYSIYAFTWSFYLKWVTDRLVVFLKFWVVFKIDHIIFMINCVIRFSSMRDVVWTGWCHSWNAMHRPLWTMSSTRASSQLLVGIVFPWSLLHRHRVTLNWTRWRTRFCALPIASGRRSSVFHCGLKAKKLVQLLKRTGQTRRLKLYWGFFVVFVVLEKYADKALQTQWRSDEDPGDRTEF